MRARFFTSAHLAVMFDPERARLHAEATLALGEKLRGRVWLAHALWINGVLSLIEGDWRGARSFSPNPPKDVLGDSP